MAESQTQALADFAAAAEAPPMMSSLPAAWFLPVPTGVHTWRCVWPAEALSAAALRTPEGVSISSGGARTLSKALQEAWENLHRVVRQEDMRKLPAAPQRDTPCRLAGFCCCGKAKVSSVDAYRCQQRFASVMRAVFPKDSAPRKRLRRHDIVISFESVGDILWYHIGHFNHRTGCAGFLQLWEPTSEAADSAKAAGRTLLTMQEEARDMGFVGSLRAFRGIHLSPEIEWHMRFHFIVESREVQQAFQPSSVLVASSQLAARQLWPPPPPGPRADRCDRAPRPQHHRAPAAVPARGPDIEAMLDAEGGGALEGHVGDRGDDTGGEKDSKDLGSDSDDGRCMLDLMVGDALDEIEQRDVEAEVAEEGEAAVQSMHRPQRRARAASHAHAPGTEAAASRSIVAAPTVDGSSEAPSAVGPASSGAPGPGPEGQGTGPGPGSQGGQGSGQPEVNGNGEAAQAEARAHADTHGPALEPSPPPLAAAAPARARGGGQRRQAHSNMVWYVGSGHIVHNASGSSLDAHCAQCSAKADRKAYAREGARSANTKAQGRPLGLLIAWLNHPCSGSSEAHRKLLKTIPYRTRRQARVDAVSGGGLGLAFAQERSPRSSESEGGEPQGWA